MDQKKVKTDIEKRIDAAADKVHQALGKTLNGILRGVPESEDGQPEIDALRGIQQSIAFHLGTIEEMIALRLTEALPNIRELMLKDRNIQLAQGAEHAKAHRDHVHGPECGVGVEEESTSGLWDNVFKLGEPKS